MNIFLGVFSTSPKLSARLCTVTTTNLFFYAFRFPRLPVITARANKCCIEVILAGYGYTHLDRFGKYYMYMYLCLKMRMTLGRATCNVVTQPPPLHSPPLHPYPLSSLHPKIR